MHVRWLCSLAALTLLAPAARAQTGDKVVPAVVIRVQSLDALLQNAKLLVKLTGEEGAAREIEKLFTVRAGVKGIKGIDTARPLGAYLQFGKEIDEVAGAVLIPIADEQSFLDLLERLNVTATKGKNDVYTVQTGKNFDVYLRFIDGYAYFTGLSQENLLGRNALDAKRILAVQGAQEDGNLLSALIRLGRFPEGARLLAQAQLEQELQKVKDKAPADETPAQKTFRVTLLREMARVGIKLLEEGNELRLDVAIDAAAKEASARISLSARAGSELAESLQGLSKNKNAFAGLVRKDSAFVSVVDFTLPAALNKALGKVIDETTEKAIGDIRDDGKRKQAEELFEALLPTLKGGQLNAAFSMNGPVGKTYTVLTALKIRGGDKLGATLQAMVEQALPDLPEAQKNKIQLDMAQVGNVKIHRFELPQSKGDRVLQDLTGGHDVYIAFRDDAVFVAVGAGALPVLKEAIANREKSAAPLFLANADVRRMVPALARKAGQQELAQQVFQPGRPAPVRWTVTGGDALTMRLQLDLAALEFLWKLKERRPDR